MFGNETVMTSNLPSLEAFLKAAYKMSISSSKDAIKARMASTDDVTTYAKENLIEYVYADMAVLNIKGNLIPEFSWMETYFDDIISYDSIRAAIAELLQDEDITKVVVIINSPGGFARGCGDTSDFLYLLGQVKDMSVAYTDSVMSSAAYWLGSQLPAVTASKYATLGSIGAYTTYTTSFRYMEELGIDTYIARSAKKKGVPSGAEPLSDLDKEVLDTYNMAQADLFLEGVRKGRKGKLVKAGWDSGETFIAGRAVELGLADNILSHVDLLNVVKNIEFR